MGRKRALLFTALPYMVSWCILAVARSVPLIYIGRLLSGLSNGWGMSLLPMYVGEIATVGRCLTCSLPRNVWLVINFLTNFSHQKEELWAFSVRFWSPRVSSTFTYWAPWFLTFGWIFSAAFYPWFISFSFSLCPNLPTTKWRETITNKRKSVWQNSEGKQFKESKRNRTNCE